MSTNSVGRRVWKRGPAAALVAALLLLVGLAAAITAQESELTAQLFLPQVYRSGADAPQPLGNDVTPGQQGFEPTVAVVNPLNPGQVAVARGCTVTISNDFGATFPIIRTTTINPCNGDPSLAYDSQGRLFMTHLSRQGGDTELTVAVGQIADTTTLGNGTYTPIFISANDGVDDDKQWLVADASLSSPYRDNLYIVWTSLGTPSRAVFSRSLNQGATWSAPQVLSVNGEGFVWPAHIAVGPNGTVYVAYHTQTCGNANQGPTPLLMDAFGGANFAAGNVPQKVTAFAAGEATVTCNVQGGGAEIPQTDFWLQGTVQPWILPDPARPGHIYVVSNDDPNDNFGNGDDGDIVIARTTNFGDTFEVSRVDAGPGQSLAVMPTAHIDQGGNIVVTWYDNRQGALNGGTGPNGTSNFLLDLYGTTSMDGGRTFAMDFRINDDPFDPDFNAPCRFGCTNPGDTQTLRIGEYNGVWAVDGFAYAVWTGNATPPPATAGNQTTYFDVFSMSGAFPDRFEPNESADNAVATALGADMAYNQGRLTLHSASDTDFFRLQALRTGTLQVQVAFNERVNDLNLRILDVYRNEVAVGAVGTLRPGNSTAIYAIPVVKGRTYFVQVFDENAPDRFPAQSSYDLQVINYGIPAVFGLDLVAESDSGASQLDDWTNVSQPTIRLRVDQVALNGLPFSPTDDANLANDDPGYKVEVRLNGHTAGFASPVAGQPGTFAFTFPAASPLLEGANYITARAFIVDATDDPAVPGTGHEVAPGPETSALIVTLDTQAPPPPSVPDLLASSDSGASDSDNVTNVNPPAFGGTGEANAIVRIRANGDLVGEGRIGTDLTDGVAGNNQGAWEVTIEPLADGTYDITAEAEDLAGNISPPSAAMAPPLVVDTGDGGMPQRPTLDLVDAFDTGRSNLDNVTQLDTLDFRVSAEAGTSVVVKDGNTVIDSFVMPGTDFTIRTLVLAEGPHPLSTESTDLAGNTSHQSEELRVTVDLTAPSISQTDLATYADTAGVSDDDVTTLRSPAFVGVEEANALIRVYGNGNQIGEGLVGADLSDGVAGNGLGRYEVTVEPLDDGVFDMTVDAEDLAGNMSGQSDALSVTIANQALFLSGADGQVEVTLENLQVRGFPGYPSTGSVVGIRDIPVVNLDLNGQLVTIYGRSIDDNIGFKPTGETSGSISRDGSIQVINVSTAAGPVEFMPGSGSDTLTLIGTADPETLYATVDVVTTAAVDGMLGLAVPADQYELLALVALDGADIIEVSVYDTVSELLLVDAGEPTSINPVSDSLNVYAMSPKPHMQKLPGGPTPESGSVFVGYPLTTDHETRIDYRYTEKIQTFK